MLFTLACYLPIKCEKKTCQDGEICQKYCNKDATSDEDNDDNDPDTEKTDLYISHVITHFINAQLESGFYYQMSCYSFHLDNISAPPPKL
jgi:hypothetical protein